MRTKRVQRLAGSIAAVALSVIAIMPSQAIAEDNVQPNGAETTQPNGGESATPGSQNNSAGDTGSTNGQNAQTPSDSGQANDQQGNAAEDDATTTQQNPQNTTKDSQPDSADAKKSDAAAAASESMDAFAAANKDVLADGRYTFASALSGHWLIDLRGGSGSKGARVQTYFDNYTTSQRWDVTHDAKGYLIITSAKSGQVLDIASGNKRPGGTVQQWGSNGSLAQRWIAVNDGDGIVLHSALAKDLVLDIPGGSNRNQVLLQTWTANGSAAQRWTATNETAEINDFAAANRSVLEDGEYGFASALNSDKLLDVTGGSTVAGANVQLYSNNRSSAQRWKVTHDANGFITFTNVKSGKVLDVYAGLRGKGVNVQQWNLNGSTAQKWVAVPAKNTGGYVIHSAMNMNLVLDLAGASTVNRTNIQTYVANGTKAQIWTVDTSPFVRGAFETTWNKNKQLGLPTTNEQTSGEYTVQQFQHGKIFMKGNGSAVYAVSGDFDSAYEKQGAQTGWLGYPTEIEIDRGSHAFQAFEHGYIVRSNGNMVYVRENVSTYWLALTGYHSWLGWPKNSETKVADGHWSQSFDGGTLHWFSDGSSVASIQSKWNEQGGASGSLGAATDEFTIQTPKLYIRTYANGAITATSDSDASKAVVMNNDIYKYWNGLGNVKSYLKLPTGNMTAVGSGYYQTFAGGVVFNSAKTGTHAVRDDILKKFNGYGGVNGTLGFPTSDETKTVGSGVYQTFQKGRIYWKSGLGTHVIANGFLTRYAQDGYERGYRGFPTSDEYNDRGHSRQNFEHGTYWWGGMPAATYSHNVRWYGQPNNYYCAPASGVMMMATAGKWTAANGTKLSVWAMAQYMHTALPNGTWENDALNGLNNWVGSKQYEVHGYPSVASLRQEVMHSFETGYAPMLSEYERRGGPHPNGHNNGTFGHAMVLDGYTTTTDRMYIADPLASYGGAQKFWYSLPAFRDNFLTWSVDTDPPAIVSSK